MPVDRGELPDYARRPKGSWIVVAENKRSARFPNTDPLEILLIHVDGGFIGEGERADYIIAHRKIVDVIIELKGSDVGKAVSQIRSTRPIWVGHKLAGKNCAALIVRGQGMHPKDTTRIERWKRDFRKHRMKLLVETRNRSYDFPEFLLPEHERA